MYNSMSGRITARFFQRPAAEVARAILGTLLVRRLPDLADPTKSVRVSGVVVEAEAYAGSEDPCCNTFGGRHTERNHIMWGAPGGVYVYFTYGMHHCMNIVAQPPGAAVLLRALQPLENPQMMLALTGRPPSDITTLDSALLDDRSRRKECRALCEVASGPARLCRAFNLTVKSHNGADVTAPESDMWLEYFAGDPAPESTSSTSNSSTPSTPSLLSTGSAGWSIGVTSRVGLPSSSPAAAWPLRFFVNGNACVSKGRPTIATALPEVPLAKVKATRSTSSHQNSGGRASKRKKRKR